MDRWCLVKVLRDAGKVVSGGDGDGAVVMAYGYESLTESAVLAPFPSSSVAIVRKLQEDARRYVRVLHPLCM